MEPSSRLLPKEARQGQLETRLGETSFPPCPLPWGSTWRAPGEEGPHGHPQHCRTETAAPALLHRPSHGTGLGLALLATSKAGQHGEGSLPSSSSPLGLCALSLGGRSGTAVGWAFMASGLRQSPAGPAGSGVRSSGAGELAALSKRNP